MFGIGSFWRGRKYHLDRMTLGDLVVVFAQYPAVIAYAVLTVAAALGIVALGGPDLRTMLWIVLGWLNFAFTWYLLHRFLLQSQLLYRSPLTARLWKRIHYDHHRDPNDLRVLFGSLVTTLPPIFAFGAAVAWVSGRPQDGLAFVMTSTALTIWNEFCHCIEHLAVEPRFAYFRRLRKLHRLHHYKNENAYYGITNFFWDRVFGTYPAPESLAASATVRTLGYDGERTARYPWVRELSERAARSGA